MFEVYSIDVYNRGFLKGYANGIIEMKNDGYGYEFLYRIDDDPANGPADDMVSIDYGYKNPKIEELWDEICDKVKRMIFGLYECACGATIIDPRASEPMVLCCCGKTATKVSLMDEYEMKRITREWFSTP